MEEKRGIKIYEFENEQDKVYVKGMINSLLRVRNLVPVIGTGFTSGIRTKYGCIPTAEELKSKMVNILCSLDNGDKDDFIEVSLKDLGDEFWEQLPDNGRQKEQFVEYISDNFTKVYDVEQHKRAFLNSDWDIIYTLNYDDTIERVIDTNVLIPYDRVHKSSKKNYLIKLHGDAKKFENTGDKKYCIIGNRQYIDLIKNEDNKDIVNILKDSFFSKNIIFIGCGLDGELDLLYSAGLQLENKSKKNQDHHIIYLAYDKEIKIMDYKKYGITDIIKVKSQTISEFYYMIHNISKDNMTIRESDTLKNYTDIQFVLERKKDDENLNYLFFNNKVKMKNNKITLPVFFTERTCGTELIGKIRAQSAIYIVYGTSFSGKSYLLLQILKNINEKKIYYFPSDIILSDEIIQQLLTKEDSVILIDDKAITFGQCKMLFSKAAVLKKKKVSIVLAINKSNSDFYNYYLKNKDMFENDLKMCELENKFNKSERAIFNKHIGDLSLVEYQENNTILDYLFKADENMLEHHKTLLPRIHFLSGESEKQIRALIVLITKGMVTSGEAIELNIDDALYELASDFPITVQKDYLSDIEKENNVRSGFKFVLNSTYWVVKCLSSYASSPANRETITDAYYNIVDSYRTLDKWKMNEKIKEYYMLDKIQLIFSDNTIKGSIMLPYLIYEKLHTHLNWNCQFLHQEAKCELRMARRKGEDTRKILELAFRNITRALELAEKENWTNIEYTRAHMKVTKALILTNYVFVGYVEWVNDVVNLYYDVFIENKSLCPELEKDELKDVKSFLGDVWEGKYKLTGEFSDMFSEIYTSLGVKYKV